jgi:hypothetical protein
MNSDVNRVGATPTGQFGHCEGCVSIMAAGTLQALNMAVNRNNGSLDSSAIWPLSCACALQQTRTNGLISIRRIEGIGCDLVEAQQRAKARK